MFGHPKDNFLPKSQAKFWSIWSGFPNNPRGWGKKGSFLTKLFDPENYKNCPCQLTLINGANFWSIDFVKYFLVKMDFRINKTNITGFKKFSYARFSLKENDEKVQFHSLRRSAWLKVSHKIFFHGVSNGGNLPG